VKSKYEKGEKREGGFGAYSELKTIPLERE